MIDKINDFKKNRTPPFSIPNSWYLEETPFESGYDYTISEKVKGILGNTSFGNKEVSISLLPYDYNEKLKNVCFCLEGNDPREATIDNVSLGQNNIQIGDIGICEHVLSLLPGLGLKLNYFLTENNFPSFDNGLDGILNKIKPYIMEKRESQFFTVKKPILLVFDGGGYFIIEPDEGEKKLIVDHQFSYKNKTLGTQRVIAEITPELFSFIAKARPISSGVRTKIAQTLFGIGFSNIPFMGFGKENALYVNDNGIINPNDKFETSDGINREGIMHEVIDKLGAIALLGGGRFVGRITSYRTSHKNDVKIIKYILEEDLLHRGYNTFCA